RYENWPHQEPRAPWRQPIFRTFATLGCTMHWVKLNHAGCMPEGARDGSGDPRFLTRPADFCTDAPAFGRPQANAARKRLREEMEPSAQGSLSGGVRLSLPTRAGRGDTSHRRTLLSRSHPMVAVLNTRGECAQRCLCSYGATNLTDAQVRVLLCRVPF